LLYKSAITPSRRVVSLFVYVGCRIYLVVISKINLCRDSEGKRHCLVHFYTQRSALRNGRASGYRTLYSCFGRQVCVFQHLCSRRIEDLRIQSSRQPFDRIRRVLPDTASRRFHATRPKPRSRKPAWLPFYTGGDPSLLLCLSAFIFCLPCGQ